MYQFLSYRESLPYKKEIKELLERIRAVVSDSFFDFSYNFTCGSSNNMVVYDDDDEPHFDVDIVPYDPDQDYTPDEIHYRLYQAFRNYSGKYVCKVEAYSSDIKLTFMNDYTCSIYIVYNFKEGNNHRQQYIKYDEDNRTCNWIYRKLKYGDVNKKISWLKSMNLWDDFQNFYIKKINGNNDSDKPLKDIFLESLYQICRTNGYDQNGNVQAETKKKAKYDFYYVEPSVSDPVYNRIVALLAKVQKELYSEYTFQYQFIGSSARNMITADRKGNVGFDFDVNIIPQNIKCKNSPEHLRKVFFDAVQRIYTTYGFNSNPENSTSVITIKKVDRKNSKCLYGCDFAIVRTTKKGRQQNVVLRKDNNKQIYVWEDRGDYYAGLSERVEFLKKSSKRWNDLRKLYIEKKNMNYCEAKKSRAIFAESVKEICDKYGYHK